MLGLGQIKVSFVTIWLNLHALPCMEKQHYFFEGYTSFIFTYSGRRIGNGTESEIQETRAQLPQPSTRHSTKPCKCNQHTCSNIGPANQAQRLTAAAGKVASDALLFFSLPHHIFFPGSRQYCFRLSAPTSLLMSEQTQEICG
jgi:hypothetical protein